MKTPHEIVYILERRRAHFGILVIAKMPKHQESRIVFNYVEKLDFLGFFIIIMTKCGKISHSK